MNPKEVQLCVMERVGAAFVALIAASWLFRRFWAVTQATALFIQATIERILERLK